MQRIPQMQSFQSQNATMPPNVGQISGIDFSAPVIRLGLQQPVSTESRRTDGPGDYQTIRPGTNVVDQHQSRLNPKLLKPPATEDIARTLYLSGLHWPLVSDGQIEEGLRQAGNLLHWCRAIDSSERPRSFGFAEFASAKDAFLASRALDELELSFESKENLEVSSSGDQRIEAKTSKIRVGPRPLHDTSASSSEHRAERKELESVQLNLRRILQAPFHDEHRPRTNETDLLTTAGFVSTRGNDTDNDPVAPNEDDLSSIPHEMRAPVAAEIASFRDRSLRRGIGRIQRDEPRAKSHVEKSLLAERAAFGSKPYASPVASHEIDFQSTILNPSTNSGPSYEKLEAIAGSRHEEETSISDDDDHERRLESSRMEAELSAFRSQERQWQQREKSRTAALEREKLRDQNGSGAAKAQSAKARQTFQEWDDDMERMRKTNLYFQDPSLWLESRLLRRATERKQDQQNAMSSWQTEKAFNGGYHEFAQNVVPLPQLENKGTNRIKLSLGAAAQKSQSLVPNKRSIQDIERLLEDESDHVPSHKLTLIPMPTLGSPSSSPAAGSARQMAAKNVAAEIPNEKNDLWAYEINWDYITDELISEDLQPFLEKQMIELLGIQEQMIVELVVEHLKQRSSPALIVQELESALDDDATTLVYRLWRMVAFFSAAGKRGLS